MRSHVGKMVILRLYLNVLLSRSYLIFYILILPYGLNFTGDRQRYGNDFFNVVAQWCIC